MDDSIVKIANNIKTKEDFDEFTYLLYEYFIENKNNKDDKDKWQNDTLNTYLLALHDSALDIHVYYRNCHNIEVDIEKPTWSMFAAILLSAIVLD